MSGTWTHPICNVCWVRKFPQRTPVRIVERHPYRCCYCGLATLSGIWVRDEPKVTCNHEPIL